MGENSVGEPEQCSPAKTSQNARFLLSEYERFGLVFTKTRVYKFGHIIPALSLFQWLLFSKSKSANNKYTANKVGLSSKKVCIRDQIQTHMTNQLHKC